MKKRTIARSSQRGRRGARPHRLLGDAGSGETPARTATSRRSTIAVFNGWDEGIAVSELWKAVLEEQGYDVNLEYADAGAGLRRARPSGDYDLDARRAGCRSRTPSYIEEYGDDIVDLGAWNDDAKLTIAVNEDAPIDSLDELADERRPVRQPHRRHRAGRRPHRGHDQDQVIPTTASTAWSSSPPRRRRCSPS